MTGRRAFVVALVAIAVLALALRVAVVRQYESAHPQADHPLIDEASYDRWARQVARGDWLGEEVFFQEPLYPYALGTVYALAGGGDPPPRPFARAVQAALGALTAVLVALLGARVFGRAAGVVAGLAMALYRPALLVPAWLLKPNLVLPALAGLALALVASRRGARPRAWLGIGALVGVGALLRGNVLVLAPLLCAWPLLRERSRAALGRCLATAAGVALVLAPVALRNLYVGGVFVLTTSGAGTNAYGGNSLENPYGVATELDFVRGIPEFEADDWRREAERRAGRELDAGEVSRFWLAELGRSVARHPWAHARVLWNKLRMTLGAYEVPDNHHLEWDARYVPLLGAPLGGFALWGSLALAGVLLVLVGRSVDGAPHADRGAALELALLVALYLGTIVATVTSMRVRLGLVPLLLPFAGHFAVRAATALRARAWRPLVLQTVALAVSALFVLWPVYGAERVDQDFAERDFNLAVQELERGELDPARALALALEGRWPDTPRVQSLLASIDLQASRSAAPEEAAELRARARERAERALAAPALAPRERFRANGVLAWIALEDGDAATARDLFAAALAFDPDAFELRLAQARATAMAGDLEGARALAQALLSDAANADARARVRILQAQIELEGARAGLAARDEDARARVQAALGWLRDASDEGLPTSVRVDARVTAARLQLALGNDEAARNHLRAAAELAPADAGVQAAMHSLDERTPR